MPASYRFYIFLAVAAWLFLCCASDTLSAGNYVRWLENRKNGLLVSRTAGPIEYELQYKTQEYQALKAVGPSLGREELTEMLADYEGLNLATLRVHSNDGKALLRAAGPEGEDSERSQYYAFGIARDIFLLEGPDTLHCVFSHLEQPVGLRPFLQILLAFEAGKPESTYDKEFVYRDPIFTQETIMFHISRHDLSRIPSLELKP